jgi:penicillin amidase
LGEKRNINFQWADPARINRIREVLNSKQKFSIADFESLQHEEIGWKTEQLVPLLANVKCDNPDAERARKMLLDWDRRMSEDSAAAAIYMVWEENLRDELSEGIVPGELGREYAQHMGSLVVPIMTKPTVQWFGPTPQTARDAMLVKALEAAVQKLKATKLGEDMNTWKWGNLHNATFRHMLAIDPDTEELLNIGPIPRGGYSDTPFATGGRDFEQNSGSSYREIMDPSNWDNSVATSAPGQSGQPGSRHFDDLAKLWAQHQYFPLSFSPEKVDADTEASLTLVPANNEHR